MRKGTTIRPMTTERVRFQGESIVWVTGTSPTIFSDQVPGVARIKWVPVKPI